MLAAGAGPYRAQILAKVNACKIEQPHGNHALWDNPELYTSVALAHGYAVAGQWLGCRAEMDHPDTGGDRIKGKGKDK
jgi:hypothetical protein